MSRLQSDRESRFPDGRPEAEQPAWRHDFPIDEPEDNYVARRDFTKFLVLTSLAFAVGQLWIAALSLYRRSRGRPPLRRIARVDDLAPGGVLTFDYPGSHDPCLLLRTRDGVLVAYGQKCTHLTCAVIPRAEEGRLFCPCHVGSFDLETGRPLAGPPRRPLPRITLEIRGDQIYATGVEERTV